MGPQPLQLHRHRSPPSRPAGSGAQFPSRGPEIQPPCPAFQACPFCSRPALLWPLAHSLPPGSTHVGGWLFLPYPGLFATSRPSLSHPYFSQGWFLLITWPLPKCHLLQEALPDHPGESSCPHFSHFLAHLSKPISFIYLLLSLPQEKMSIKRQGTFPSCSSVCS